MRRRRGAAVVAGEERRAAAAAAALGAAVVGAFVAMYLPQPLLPAIAVEFGAGAAASASLVSVLTLAIALASPVLAPLSDRFGRRPLLVGAAIGLVPAALACALAPTLGVLLALRALQGALVAMILSGGWAYLGEEFDRRLTSRMAGWFVAATVSGGIVSRLIGGAAGDLFGWRGAFVASALVSAAAATLLVLLLPRSRGFRAARGWAEAARASLDHWRHPELRRLYLVGFAIFFSFLGLFNALPFRLAAAPYALPASLIGLTYLTYVAGALSANLAGPILERYGPHRVLVLGTVAIAACHLATGFGSLPAIIVALALLCFAHFLVQSVASGLVAVVAREARAGASAHYLFAYYLGGSLGSVVAVVVWQAAAWSGVALVNAGVMLVAMAAAWPLRIAGDPRTPGS